MKIRVIRQLLPVLLLFSTTYGSAVTAQAALPPSPTIAEAPAKLQPPSQVMRHHPTAPALVATIAPQPTSVPTIAGPTRIAGGNFYDLIHKGQGTATLSKQINGSFDLTFSNFKVETGPDLFVYLVPADKIPKVGGNHALVQEALDLGKLQKMGVSKFKRTQKIYQWARICRIGTMK
ncbi:MAG: hypothetical protein WCL57_12220 [Chloroflexota bacterium]|jgi:hypothetical protein